MVPDPTKMVRPDPSTKKNKQTNKQAKKGTDPDPGAVIPDPGAVIPDPGAVITDPGACDP